MGVLSGKANPNAHDDKTPPPLITACKLDHVYLVKKLIQCGADVNRLWCDPTNVRNPPCTPLTVSIKARSDYQVKTLLELNADPNRRLPPSGDSHTMFAARLAKEQSHQNSEKGKEHQKLVKVLVDYGANCDMLNDLNESLWDIVAAYPDFKEKLELARRKYVRRQQVKKEQKLKEEERNKQQQSLTQSHDHAI